MVKKILQSRGMTEQEIDDLLNINFDGVTKIPNLDKAAISVMEAFFEGAKFGVFYDVDTDGINGGTIVRLYMETLTGRRIPPLINMDRSHGLNNNIIKQCVEKGINYLICVDSSTNDISQLNKLKKLGIRVVILDHHEIESLDQPSNTILVNCKNKGSSNQHLSGAAVAFRFIEKLDKMVGGKHKSLLPKLEQLAGITIFSDYCNFRNLENRYLANKALDTPKNFVLELYSEWGLYATSLNFNLIPAINALIRTGKADLAVDLVYTHNREYALKLKKEAQLSVEMQNKAITNMFNQRKAKVLDKIIFFDITGLDPSPMKKENIFNIAGLVATKLKALFKIPSIVVCKTDNGGLRGSFRGDLDFDFKGLFNRHGVLALGHKTAFGLYGDKDFFKRFNKIYGELPPREMYLSQIRDYDLELDQNQFITEEVKIFEIAKFNELTGNGLPKIKIKLGLDPNKIIFQHEPKYSKGLLGNIEVLCFDRTLLDKYLKEKIAIIAPSLGSRGVQFILE